MSSNRRAVFPLVLGALIIAAGGGLVGCAVEPSPAVSSPPVPSPTEIADTVEEETTDPGGDDDPRFGIGLATTGEVIAKTLENVSGHSVEGGTLTITFSEGDSGFDGMMDCLSVGGLLEDGEELILEYPNGSVECP